MENVLTLPTDLSLIDLVVLLDEIKMNEKKEEERSFRVSQWKKDLRETLVQMECTPFTMGVKFTPTRMWVVDV